MKILLICGVRRSQEINVLEQAVANLEQASYWLKVTVAYLVPVTVVAFVLMCVVVWKVWRLSKHCRAE